MSPFVAVCFVVGLMLTLWRLHDFGRYAGHCPMCGGRTEHESDCIWREKDD